MLWAKSQKSKFKRDFFLSSYVLCPWLETTRKKCPVLVSPLNCPIKCETTQRACVPERTHTRSGSGRQSGSGVCANIFDLSEPTKKKTARAALRLPRLISDMPRTARRSPGFTLDLALNRLGDLTKKTEDARMWNEQRRRKCALFGAERVVCHNVKKKKPRERIEASGGGRHQR